MAFAEGMDSNISSPTNSKSLKNALQFIPSFVPNSDGAIDVHVCEAGLIFYLRQDIPDLISENIESNIAEALQPSCGPAIVDQVEAKLGLKHEKLRASRHALAGYCNMFGACVLFILDEMRKKSAKEGLRTTGEGLDWGVLLCFGPDLTVETVVLHSVAT
ncbi:hypothetical protein SLEP1_g4115 [Rubroshorea leprosula]|uniref:Chalcone/stilbene synthase C-terminal domain-containing protein n=1 Tax=Rubroshorea leprosula TaxID=152421 RepID=A0AAV5HYC5_9ROSI|nr:hypothetical protein SLEP1_g4115 [Rubroshorea leprosula]